MAIHALAGSTVSATLSSVLIRLCESAFGSSMSCVGEATRFLLAVDEVVVTSAPIASLALFFWNSDASDGLN